jgi:hypothetical protein
MPKSTTTQLTTARGRDDLATRDVIETAGGLPALEEALELAGANPSGEDPIDILLSQLRDPAFASRTPTELARQCGLSRLELHDLLGKRAVALAIFESRHKHLGRVIDDIGEDALSTVVNCKGCGGKGSIPLAYEQVKLIEAQAQELRDAGIHVDDPNTGPVTCEDCNGIGKLRKIGDAEARKLFFKLHGFDRPAPAVVNNVTTNTQINNNNHGRGLNGVEPVTVTVERILDGG